VASGSRLFFVGYEAATGSELWISDGTGPGTQMVADLVPGMGSGAPDQLIGVGQRVYFQANLPAIGKELFVSDGTKANTALVSDFWPGRRGSDPKSPALCAGRLYWSADDLVAGREPCVVDLPGASVESVALACRPTYPRVFAAPPVLGKVANLAGDDGPSGHVGAVFLSALSRTTWPVGNGCSIHLDLTTLLTHAVVVSSSWTAPLPIPNDRALEGLPIALQTIWFPIPTVVPVVTGDALVLGLGL
jgi:ELWxxDGT repeat protein